MAIKVSALGGTVRPRREAAKRSAAISEREGRPDAR
jgi:hypothetical protein